MRAPAKVNLDLFIDGRRDDGFHELRTTMLMVGLYDEIRMGTCREPGVHFTQEGPALSRDVPTDSSNLAVGAVEQGLQALQNEGHEVPGIKLALIKHIPIGAGLGGGSSDGAAALAGLQELLDLQLDGGPAQRILAGLGSDCAFFHGARETGLGLCFGRGERVQALPGPQGWWLVLLTPDLQVSTPAVFGALQASALGQAPPAPVALAWSTFSADQARAKQHNDLEPAALRAVPALQEWRAALDARFHLSGSGSSFYCLCEGESLAHELLQELARELHDNQLQPRLLTALPLALDCTDR